MTLILFREGEECAGILEGEGWGESAGKGVRDEFWEVLEREGCFI